MSLVINTNIASLNAQRNLVNNSNNLSLSVQRLSSGLRINSAKDDAAGLAISEKLSAHIRSINVAVRNAQDGISLAQTAEGGLQEMGNLLARMRELSVQSSNETLSSTDRAALNQEFEDLRAEIDRISDVTEFNGTKLLDGTVSTSAGIDLQVGFHDPTSADANKITIGSSLGDFASAGTIVNVGAGGINTISDAQAMISTVDTAISNVNTERGKLGAVQNRLESTISNLRVASENLSAAKSRIVDTDFAQETASLTKNQILVQAATAVLAQANVLPQQALQLLR